MQARALSPTSRAFLQPFRFYGRGSVVLRGCSVDAKACMLEEGISFRPFTPATIRYLQAMVTNAGRHEPVFCTYSTPHPALYV